ncbi:CinA family protein [Chloroflexota bacterium]
MKTKLEEEVGRLLREQGLTVATAESTTGGLISSLLNDVAGSSKYYKGCVVAYTHEVKVSVLGVSGDTMGRSDVSHEVCAEMAEGVRKLMNVDISLAETGIAGPTGGTPQKPIGTFYIALSSEKGTDVRLHVFQGDRLENKRSTTQVALNMLYEYLSESAK